MILNRVREDKGTFGYNAASVAGLFLTTEASITETPKQGSHSHAAPPGMDM